MKLAMAIALAPAMAEASILGTWCADGDEPALYIEADSLGLGEHRVCDWAMPHGDTDSHDTKATCRQIYIDDKGNPVVLSETTYDITARLTDPDHLSARFDDGTTQFRFDYTRCDG
jgi:hypothetical protein